MLEAALRGAPTMNDTHAILRHDSGGVRLHLGCGADHWPGWVNVDASASSAADVVMDMRALATRFPRASVREVALVHSLQYLRLAEARDLFRALFELLEPGGRVAIECPSAESAARKLLSSEGDPAGWLEGVRALHSFGLDDLAARRAFAPGAFAWSPWHLRLELEGAGFAEVREKPAETHVAWRDFRMEARRPASPARAAASAPRRALFLVDRQLGHGTAQVRGQTLREPLAARGWLTELVDVHEASEDAIVRCARSFELVYLLKVNRVGLVRRLRAETGARIVFDLIDALWSPHHRRAGWQDLESILGAADAIFTENSIVTESARRFGLPLHLVPVCAQVERFEAARRRLAQRGDGAVVLGWVGSRGTARALGAIEAPLRAVLSRHAQVRLRALGCEAGQIPAGLPRERVSCVPDYDEAAMIREVLGFDVGLYPPPLDLDDYAARGIQKAAIYMAARVPVVLQRAGEALDLVRDGESGMLAGDGAEWQAKLDALVRSAALRREIGDLGFERVRERHSLAGVAAALDAAFSAVLAAPRRAGA